MYSRERGPQRGRRVNANSQFVTVVFLKQERGGVLAQQAAYVWPEPWVFRHTTLRSAWEGQKKCGRRDFYGEWGSDMKAGRH